MKMKNEIWKTLTAKRVALATDYAIRFASNFWDGTSEEDKNKLALERIRRHWTPITNMTKLINGARPYRFEECGVNRARVMYVAVNKWGFTEQEAREISLRVYEATQTIMKG